MNQGAWMGRFTADPELKTTSSGVEYCSFQLAIDRGFKDKDGNRQTDFLPFTAWKQTAVFINKYFHKGDLIAITGSVQSRKYEDKEGLKRTTYAIAVERAMFCGGKKQGAGAAHGSDVQASEPSPSMPGSDDELPF